MTSMRPRRALEGLGLSLLGSRWNTRKDRVVGRDLYSNDERGAGACQRDAHVGRKENMVEMAVCVINLAGFTMLREEVRS